LSGEIESAIVGGVSLLQSEDAFRLFDQRGILSSSKEFHLFDRRAKGAVLGEGAGLVWLKTMDKALQDGDSIYAVVKAVSINNDGRTAGPASPSFQSQKEVMQNALVRSGKLAEEVRYIDVNGSGTEVTDLLELKAIEAVYRPSSATECELGSVKPNIGHPLCAEGIASFIKSALMLHYRQRIPFLSASEPMLHYDLALSPFRFARIDSVDAPAATVAAVSCFADGGTNAHVILEAWRETNSRIIVHTPVQPPQLSKIEIRHRKPRIDPSLTLASDRFSKLAKTYAGQDARSGHPETNFWKRLD